MRQLRFRLSSPGSLQSLVCILAGALALLFAVPAQAQINLYASPGGSSTSTCDSTTPCTLARAQAYVETLTPSMSSDIIVNLAAGTYTLSSTWTFNSANGDSGTGGHNVIWQASGYGTSSQASVTISGGQPVTGWTLWDSTNNIWKAAAPVNPLSSRQLYVNGLRVQRATAALPVTLTANGDTGYTASSSTMASWHNPSAIELVFTPYAFIESRCDVSSISGTSINMDSPCFSFVRGGNDVFPAYAENAYELLSAPGQWYLDTSGSVDGSGVSTIYYIPRSGESMSTATVIVPVLETLVSGQGTLSTPLQNIQFKGLTFAYATWLEPNSNYGYPEVADGMYVTTTGSMSACCSIPVNKPLASVSFSAATNVLLQGNLFQHLGGVGVNFEYGSQNNTVIGNEFTDISNTGIVIGDPNDYQPTDSRAMLVGNTIQDNYIHDMPVEYHGGVGIFQAYSQNDVITHNQIDNLPYDGISSGWGLGGMSVYIQGNQFTNNLIFNAVNMLSDGGSIYTQAQQGPAMATGAVISGNVLHDQSDAYHALYDDAGSQYITLQNNVTYNLGSNVDSWGGCPPPGGDMTFQNNYGPDLTASFAGAFNLPGCTTPPGLTVSGNTQISGLSACQGITACNNILNGAGLESAWQCLLTESCNGGGGDTTVTFSNAPNNTPLTGVYGGIDWGSQLWYTNTGYAWINSYSAGPLSQTFTLPAGTVLKSMAIFGCTGSSVTLASSGNPNVTFNPPNGAWTAYSTGWTTASATVTVTATCSSGVYILAFTNIVYGNPPSSTDTTVTFSNAPNNTPLIGVYGGIDWGSQLWYTNTGYAWINSYSAGPLSQTFTLPAGTVLKSMAIFGCTGSSVTVSSSGNADQTFNPPASAWTAYSTGWTTASATVTLTATCSSGVYILAFTNIVYGSP